jgi:hypothetical protein
MSSALEIPFRPQQIVCIEHAELCLFAEVIQLVPERERCWAKCLALGSWQEDSWQLLYDLRESSQLILPISVFRVAMDTEVLPLLTELWQSEALGFAEERESRQALHHFVSAIGSTLAAA